MHDNNQSLIEHIYNVAIDPDRIFGLIQRWEQTVGIATPNDALPYQDFNRILFSGRNDQIISALDSIIAAHDLRLEEALDGYRSATFIVNNQQLIVAVNPASANVFGLISGHKISDLKFTPDDSLALSETIDTLFSSNSPIERVIRVRPKGSSGTILMHVRSVDIGSLGRHVIIVTSEFFWTAELTELLRGNYKITPSEIGVLKSLTRGETVTDIALNNDRTEGTIRSQIHSLLQKTECQSQSELIRLAMTLLQSTAVPLSTSALALRGEKLSENVYKPINLPDGRKYYYMEFGDPDGKPFILFPSSFARWPLEAERQLYYRKIRIIIPIRAGYGPSSKCPADHNIYDVASYDIACLMQHLGINRCPAIAICDDFKIAVHAAKKQKGLFSSIIGISPTMPHTKKEHFLRLNKYTRIIQMNATHAPRALPYITLLFFHWARRVGRKKFFEAMFASSPTDLKALQNPQFLDALITGSDLVLTENFMAHSAWSLEMVEFAKDWEYLLLNVDIPITILSGHQDKFAPIVTTREFANLKKDIKLIEISDAGQMLVYTHWKNVVSILENHAN